jgi:signal transduction histidine kinase
VSDERRREFYDIMLADSERLQQTVEQVLRAGRATHKQQSANSSAVDLAQMARECLELIRVRYNLNADAFSYAESLDENGARVMGDAEELRAAVSNLLDNAVKYSNKQVQISVEVATLDEKRVAVRVADRGVGIPQAQLKRIFKRFYRVQGGFMKRFKGTGLGLFIVRSVVERHGGKVFAESEGLGRGSTFTILLPRT